MPETLTIIKKQCDTLLKRTFKINALAMTLSDNLFLVQDGGIPASNLAEIIDDYNHMIMKDLDELQEKFKESKPEGAAKGGVNSHADKRTLCDD